MGFVVPGAPEGSTEIGFCSCFWRSPGSNLRPLVYKASDLATDLYSFSSLMNTKLVLKTFGS